MLDPTRDLSESELEQTRKIIGRISYYEKRRKAITKSLEECETPAKKYKLADINEKIRDLNRAISLIYIGANPNEPKPSTTETSTTQTKPKKPEPVPAPIKRPRGRPRKTPVKENNESPQIEQTNN